MWIAETAIGLAFLWVPAHAAQDADESLCRPPDRYSVFCKEIRQTPPQFCKQKTQVEDR